MNMLGTKRRNLVAAGLLLAVSGMFAPAAALALGGPPKFCTTCAISPDGSLIACVISYCQN